jgi:hypothetical protein
LVESSREYLQQQEQEQLAQLSMLTGRRVKAPIPSNAEIVEIEKKAFLVCVTDRTVLCITEVIRVIHVAKTK